MPVALAHYLNHKPTRCAHIKCPGMGALWRISLETIINHALIDIVDSLIALLTKAYMKRFRIGYRASFHQRKRQPVVIEKDGESLVASLVAQPEVLFKKLRSRRNIGDRQINMVEFHAGFSLLKPNV